MWTGVGIAAAGVVGALASSSAAGSASDAMVDASGRSTAEQRRQFELTRSDNAPFIKTGTAANARLSALLGLTRGPGSVVTDRPLSREEFDSEAYLRARPDVAASSLYRQDPYGHYLQESGAYGKTLTGYKLGDLPPAGEAPLLRKFSADDLNADPVYQSGLKFGEDQGTGAINARATASGMYDSGATIKALTRFSNDYGSTKANESYNRFTNDQNNTFNKLSGVSGTGQVATNQVASAGTSMANNVSNDITGAGNARAAGIVGGANAWGGAINAGVGAANNYQSNKRLDALLASRGQPYYTGYGSGGDYQYG